MTTTTRPTAKANAQKSTKPADEAGSTQVPGATTPPLPTSKVASVIALLERKQGATLAELTNATGWQPHSARAALTGLRKQGYVLEKSKQHDVTCYHIAVRT